MANPLLLSADGLAKLKEEEGVIEGLYNDPSRFCTFGVGHLVHPAEKWGCFLLEAASADDNWKANVEKKWPGKSYETPYLTRNTAFADKFNNLKEKAIEKAKLIVAKKK